MTGEHPSTLTDGWTAGMMDRRVEVDTPLHRAMAGKR
jgi:hypothetical protein